ncbi:MAG: adenylate kinase [Clostridia bacterium]|nr:adenylate kinase [Clostridia bacterium]
MKLLLVGPVGSGKGTQAAIISKKYGIPHISTGEIFRQHMQNKTELGLKAQEYINAGYLVPEEITFGIVKDRLSQPDCKNGFILDGYPRTMEQAHNLEKITDLDKVILIHLSEEEIIHRLSSRRMCSVCNQPSSLEWLKDGKCEKCGGEVYVRNDDKPEVIKTRLETNRVSEELINFYKNKGIFYKINATNEVEKTFALLESLLNE